METEVSQKIEIGKSLYWLLEVFRFVISARAKKTTRYSLQQILIDENHAVATDGHRLHVAYFETPLTDRYRPGLYEVIKATKTNIILLKSDIEGSFPQWQDVIPHYGSYFETNSGNGGHFLEKTLGILGRHNVSLNSKFLSPFDDCDREWRVFYDEFNKPVRFVSYEKTCRLEAVIMPVNTELSQIKCTTKSQRRKYGRN